MSKIKFQNKLVTLDIKPGTQFRLAQAGFSFMEDMQDGARATLASVELLRICSGTDKTSEEVADSLKSFEPLIKAVIELIDEEEAKLPKEGTTEGNG